MVTLEYAQEVVDNVPAGLLVLSPELRVVAVNRWFLDTFHLRREEVVGRELYEVIQPVGPPRRVAGAAEEPQTSQEVFLTLPVPGTTEMRDVRVTLNQMQQAAENRVLLVIEDLSESQRLRTAAEASERRLRELVENLRTVIWEARGDSRRFSFVSRQAEEILGYPVEKWLGEPDFWLRRLHPDDSERTLSVHRQAIAEGRDHDLEYRILSAKGQWVWIRDIVRVLKDSSNQVTQLRGFMVNITERKLVEDQLLQAQKMESVGRLAGGVAHDFNNLLTIINGYGQLVRDQLDADDPRRVHLEEILKAGDRAASLTRQLLAFSRRQVLAPQVLDLNTVVSNMQKMLRRLIGEDVELVTDLSSDLGHVKADPGQIEQVIMNLAVNARDAMPQGGRLTIETQNVDFDPVYARSHFNAPPGPYVLLAVSDTGVGMDAVTQAHLFEPFFTTKEKGRGTGLGLAMVYGIVKQSGGYIWLYSEPGKGSSFKVYLPRVEDAVRAQAPAEAAKEGLQGWETVLLVEDEAALRTMVRRVLESNGYRVLEARHGDDALQVVEQHVGPVHLLLTDVVMPGMSGRELAEHLTSQHRGLKVLFMSGYTDDAIVHHGVLHPGAAFLQKPFTPEGMVRRVREVLDSNSSTKPPQDLS